MVEEFCKSILQIVGRNSKALANLIMGLACQTFASSVVAISLSKCYHYQYSSINKVIDTLDKPLKKEQKNKKEKEEGENALSRSVYLSRLEVEKKFVR